MCMLTTNDANKGLVLRVRIRCGSHLANEFDGRSVLHGQESLASCQSYLFISRGKYMNDHKNVQIH